MPSDHNRGSSGSIPPISAVVPGASSLPVRIDSFLLLPCMLFGCKHITDLLLHAAQRSKYNSIGHIGMTMPAPPISLGLLLLEQQIALTQPLVCALFRLFLFFTNAQSTSLI